MKRIYSRSLLKLQNILISNSIILHQKISENSLLSLRSLNQIITQNGKNRNNSRITTNQLKRLSDDEIRTLLKVPCPVSEANGNEVQRIIERFKILRNSYTIKENKVCNKCPLANKCSQNQEPAITNKQAKLQDLLLFLYALNQKQPQQYTILRWSCGYKVTQSLSIILADITTLHKQSLLYRQVEKNREFTERQQQIERTDPHQIIPEIFAERRYQFK